MTGEVRDFALGSSNEREGPGERVSARAKK